MQVSGRIVVVEDESIVALDICRQLISLGYDVPETFASAEELLAALPEIQPDLVLLDIELAGEMDGLVAAALIRHEYNLPVILLTAYADDRTVERAKDSDPFAYIIKPFDARELRTQVSLALHRHDVEKRLAERERDLRRAQKLELVGRITGGVAHDFNNLLTVILGYSKLIMKEAKQDPRNDSILKSIEGIRTAALKSAGLTRQLLAFSRRQPAKPVPVELNRVFSELQPIMRGLMSERIDVQFQAEANAGVVVIDIGLIEQVILNLVLNARDAMPDGGTLTIRSFPRSITEPLESFGGTVEPGDYGVISVEDSGTGIPDEHMEEIFEPFFTTKAEGDGAGLGLSTVYGIVKQLGGHLFVHSRVGQGTKFEIAFAHTPLSAIDGKPESEAEGELNYPQGAETVLIVEEDPPLRHLMAQSLGSIGYSIVEARNAGEALLCLEDTRSTVDIVLLDVVLSHVSIEVFIRRLLGIQADLRFLLIGTPGTPGAPEEFPFLPKPFEIERLCTRIREVLDLPVS
ncbi:MAG: hybrid sensor histidine kinase/response regulator [Spirochaetaceae bacterium]|nr:MAG: hybrid sensor histidine kinase/response regulator [Spirochaetaceae bacterium]